MDQPRKLVEPPARSPLENAIAVCEEIIEEGIDDVVAIRAGGVAKRPSHLGGDYDLPYAQGRKDACRIVLLALRGREHITSEDRR